MLRPWLRPLDRCSRRGNPYCQRMDAANPATLLPLALLRLPNVLVILLAGVCQAEAGGLHACDRSNDETLGIPCSFLLFDRKWRTSFFRKARMSL